MRPLASALAVLAVAGALAGCVSVFPKQQPAQLFRFGVTTTPAEGQAGERFGVMNSVTSFEPAAATDRILTVSGNEAAYIKGSRWVAPAPSLFDDAMRRAFEAGGPARLIARGEVVRPDYVLKVDVIRFEARYDHGAGAAPTVVVALHAALDRTSDRALAGDRTFEARIDAADNRVGAIAQAFDQAVTKTLTDLVAWVGAKGQA
ncbi:MAG TPA: ABC-type transport auxiliary lipoprotein family protein [Caulobacteraceae bacterium]|nr:ABC-type transport auxiliary lipoprotein family protein [Caulobacteraceae bacterium]